MASDNYYDILGVSKSASEADIKKAYRKLAKENHPDRHPGDKYIEEKFKKINEAYDTLSDSDKRHKYDNMQSNSFGRSSFSRGFNSNDMDSINDIFSQFFGRRMNDEGDFNTNSNQNEELNISLGIKLSFEETFNGVKKTINYPIDEVCSFCKGEGFDPSSKLVKCSKCNGVGYVTNSSPFGKFRVKCDMCNGRGSHHENICSHCHGTGKMKINKTIPVMIPAGAYNGMNLRVNGCGHSSKNGAKGDMFLHVIAPDYSSDGKFKRSDGFNIEYDLNLTYYELLVNDGFTIKLPNNSIKQFKIPKNGNAGSIVRLKNCGFKMLTGNLNSQTNGDLLIHIKLKPVSNLTKEQKDLLKKFDDSLKNK